jgi:hypothetical protein
MQIKAKFTTKQKMHITNLPFGLFKQSRMVAMSRLGEFIARRKNQTENSNLIAGW